jgi:Xaa-Pro aminopeptidase
MNVSGRLARLAETSSPQLVLRMEDIRWLTGFTGGTAQLVVDPSSLRAWLLVDGRYTERAESEIVKAQAEVEIVSVQSGTTFTDAVASLPIGNEISVDPAHLTAAHYTLLQSKFVVHAVQNNVDDLRRIKNDDEVEVMSQAASIADAALQEVVSDGLLGKSEREIRNQLDYLMRRGGADDVGFQTIVATGSNGARPHHEPTDTVIESGHGVVIDMGALVDGYRSDMTRTVLVGVVPNEYRIMFDVVRSAQQAGLDAVTAGVLGSDVDAAVRKVFSEAGLEHEFVHGTGHGIGLFIHEPPILSPRCNAVLGAGEVVTVEPGLYRKGVGGVRVEDLVVVTDTTCRILTLTPKDLTCPRSQQTI